LRRGRLSRQEEWHYTAEADVLLLTGCEHAARVEERTTYAEARAARLAAKLREMGLDPEEFRNCSSSTKTLEETQRM